MIKRILYRVQRNYRFFFMFVFSLMLLCLYVHGFCWVYIKKIMNSEDISVWKAMTKTPASIVLIIYTFLALWFVGGLSVFHLYLISTNQVTSSSLIYLRSFCCIGILIRSEMKFLDSFPKVISIINVVASLCY